MASTFLGIEMGKRSLIAHQKGMHVVGQNLSNADNKAYSRQRIVLSSALPLYEPALNREERPGQIGQGVEVTAIRRERNIYLDVRLGVERSFKSFWEQSQANLRQLEDIHKALDAENLQEHLDRFWSSWQELAKNPSEVAVKQELVQRSENLSAHFRKTFERMNALRHELNDKVSSEVLRTNKLGKSLAEINTKILQSQALGDNPNDLMDKRDQLISELSRLVNVEINYRDPNEIMVFIGGKVFIQGAQVNPLQLASNPNNQGLYDLQWANTAENVQLASGSIHANILARDELLKDHINRLDTLAITLIRGVNTIHDKGFNGYSERAGLFFDEHFLSPNLNGDYDADNDGIADSTLVFEVVGGSRLQANAVVGSDGVVRLRQGGEFIDVAYQSDDRIEEVVERINNSGVAINVHFDHEGRLVVKGSARSEVGFAINYLEDTGEFLTAIAGVLSARNVAFDSSSAGQSSNLSEEASVSRTPMHHPSGSISVRAAIASNPRLVASAEGTDTDGVGGADKSHGTGNGNIALEIAGLRHHPTMFDGAKNFNAYYVSMVEDVGSKGMSAEIQSNKYHSIVSNLEDLKQSFSGVNIDEEMAHMVSLQHGYRASAKLVSVMDELLDTLINRMA